MGYRASRNNLIKWKRLLATVAVTVLCLVVAAACIFSAFVPAETWKYYVSLPNAVSAKDGELMLHYLDAENGDCTLIQLPDGKTVLVGGGADDGQARKNIFRYLNALKIKRIDVLIVTDASSRGVGALGELVANYQIDCAYLPRNASTKEAYTSFVLELQRKGIPSHEIKFGEILSGENYLLRMLYPLESAQEDDESILTLSFGGTDVLLGRCDNAIYERLLLDKKLGLLEKWGVVLEDFEIAQIQTSVNEEILSEFLQEFSCETAIFSCRGGKTYSPTEENLQVLSDLNRRVYRTDEDGHVTVSIGRGGYTVATVSP